MEKQWSREESSIKANIFSRLKVIMSVLVDRVKHIEVEMTSVNENNRLQVKIIQGTSVEIITVSTVTLNMFFQKYVK